MNGSKINLNEEVRLVPWWAWTLAGAAFLCFQWLFHVYVPQHEHNPPPFQMRIFLSLLIGIAMIVYFLLLGYVNVDAKRRGMNRALWTVIVMLVPNAIGFILYFFLRQPIVGACPACGAGVQSGFNFCPRCNHKLVPTCGVCQRALRPGDTFCPYCGAKLGATAAPPAISCPGTASLCDCHPERGRSPARGATAESKDPYPDRRVQPAQRLFPHTAALSQAGSRV